MAKVLLKDVLNNYLIIQFECFNYIGYKNESFLKDIKKLKKNKFQY